MTRRAYTTDLSDAEWACLAPYVPAPKPGGRPAKHSRRKLLDAIFSVIRSGGAWRLVPNHLPPWRTVYDYWRVWRLDGTWERIHTALRERLRVRLGRTPQPSASIIDSQSVKTTKDRLRVAGRLLRLTTAYGTARLEAARAPPKRSRKAITSG